MRLAGGAFVLCAFCAQGQQESAEAIMTRVAANQDRAQEMRSAFVYHQSILIRMQRGNGKLAREEQREYTVTPTAKGFQKDLTHFEGKYEKHGQFMGYNEPGYTYKDIDIDGELINDLANDLANDKETRDGIAKDLFPLTAARQKRFAFRLEGKENYRGADVYRITFKPKKVTLADCDDGEGEGSCWAGEVLVDIHEYQPVLVTTWLARGIPMAVQVLLGTNLQHLGFKVAYKKFDEGLWFPVTYGGEFRLKAVFFYKRTIAIALSNSGFQKADVTSKVSFEELANP